MLTPREIQVIGSGTLTGLVSGHGQVIFDSATKHVYNPQLYLFSNPIALFYYFFQVAMFWLFAKSFTLIQTDSNGIYYCYYNNVLHNENGPAVYSTTIHMYVRKGKFHREDGPAIQYLDSDTEYWMQNGILHREDGPAVRVHGNEYWLINGKRLSHEEIEEQKFRVFFSHHKNII